MEELSLLQRALAATNKLIRLKSLSLADVNKIPVGVQQYNLKLYLFIKSTGRPNPGKLYHDGAIAQSFCILGRAEIKDKSYMGRRSGSGFVLASGTDPNLPTSLQVSVEINNTVLVMSFEDMNYNYTWGILKV